MAVGYQSETNGFTSFAFGTYNKALSDYAQAFGKNSIASGQVSTAIGEGIRSEAQFSMAVGRWNIGGGTAKSWIGTEPLFEIGNGGGDGSRSNALTVYKSGDAIFHNSLHIEEGLQVGSLETPAGYLASFDGKVLAEGIKILLRDNWEFPDYVFAEDYALRPLSEVKAYIDLHHHLPEVPSASSIAEEGMSLEEMNILLLKKVEELTLYILDQEERIKKLESE